MRYNIGTLPETCLLVYSYYYLRGIFSEACRKGPSSYDWHKHKCGSRIERVNVSLTLFQSYCDGTCMRQVIVLQLWNAPVAGTWQEHPIQSLYKLTPGRPAIFLSTHLYLNAEHKQGSNWYHLFSTFGMLWLGIKPKPSLPQGNALPMKWVFTSTL